MKDDLRYTVTMMAEKRVEAAMALKKLKEDVAREVRALRDVAGQFEHDPSFAAEIRQKAFSLEENMKVVEEYVGRTMR